MATQQEEIEQYNYAAFGSGGVPSDFLAFRSLLPVGSSAPDFEVTALDTGKTVKLSDHWRQEDLVIEFGSLT